MGVNKGTESSAPPSRFPQSIWSVSSDEQSLNFVAGGSPPRNVYNSPRLYPSHTGQELTPMWSSPFNSTSPRLAQQNMIGPTQSFAQSPRLTATVGAGLNHQHQRLPSLSSPSFQAYPSFNQSQSHETFLYSSTPAVQQQLPVSRQMDHHSSVLLSPPNLSSGAFSNIGGPLSVAAAFGNPLAVAPASPQFGGSPNVHGHASHARQVSLANQPHHSPHQSHSYRPHAQQPFSSVMPQAW